MGLFSFVLRLPVFFKLGKTTGGDMDPDGYYVHHLAIDEECHGRGIGRDSGPSSIGYSFVSK